MNSTHPETSKEDVSEPEDGEILDEGEEEDEKLVVQGRRNPPYSRNAYHYRRRSGRRARKNGHSHDTRQNRRLRNNNNNHSRKADEQENTSPGDYLHYLESFGRRNKLISEKRLSSSSKGSEGEPRSSRDISRSSGKRDDHKGKELAGARVSERHSRTSTSGRIVKPNKSPVKLQSHSKPGPVTDSGQNEKQQVASTAPSSSASPNFDAEVKFSNPIPNASANTEDVSADEMEDDEDSAPSIQILSDDGENEKTAPEIITLDATDSSDGEHGHHGTSPKKTTSGFDGFGEDVDAKKVDSDGGSSTDFEISGIPSEPENENEHNEKQVEPNINCTIPRDDVVTIVTNKVSPSPIIQSVNFDSSDILDVDGKDDLMHVNTDAVKEVLGNELDLGVEKDSHLSDEEIDVLELRNKLLSELVSKTDASEVQIKDQDVMKECMSNISVKIINDIDTSSSTIHTNKLPEHDNNEEEEAEALRAVVLSLLSKKKSNQRPSSPPPANSIQKKGLSTVVNDKLQQETRVKSRTGSSDHNKEDSRRSSTESQLSGASKGSSRRRSNNSSDRSNRARSPPSSRRRRGKAVGDRKNSSGNDDYSKTRDTRHRPTAPISVKSNERISAQNRSRAATLSPPLNRDVSQSQNPALHNTNSNESFLSTHTVKDLPDNDLRKQLLKHAGGGVGPQKRTCILDHQIAPTTSSNYDSVLESGNKRRREEEETIFRRIVNFSNEGSQTENVSATSITWTEPMVTAASHPNDTVLSTHQSVTPTSRHDAPPFTSSTFASSQASNNDHQRLATPYATQNPNPRLPFEAPSVFTRLTAPGHPPEQRIFNSDGKNLGFHDIAANPSQFPPTHLHQSGSNVTLQQPRLNVPPLMSALPQDSSFLVAKIVPTIQSFGISNFAPRQGVRNVAPIPNISGNQTELINAPPPNAWDWRSGGTSGIRNNLRFEGVPLINTNNTGNISSLGNPRIATTNTSTLIQVPLSKTIASVSSTVKANSVANIKTTEETTLSSKKAHLSKSKTGKGKTLPVNKEDSTSSNKSFPKQKQQLMVKVPQQPPSTNKSSSKTLPRIVIPVRDNDSTSDEMEDADDQGLLGDAPPMGNEFQKKLDELLKRAREASESKITEKENEKQVPTESTPAQQTSEQEDNASINQPSTCDKPTMPSKVIEELPRTLTMTSTSSSSVSSKTPLLSSITKKSAKPDVPKQSSVSAGHGSILDVVQPVPLIPSSNEATISVENPTTSKAPLVTKPSQLQMKEIKVPAAPVPITIDLNKKPLKRPASPIASKKIIEDLTKKVAESNNLLSLSAKEKELLNSRQSCFTELREIQKSLQQHTRLRNLDAKFESEIASVQKKLDQLKSKQQSVRSKASDVNQFIKEKSKLVLPLKANCISLERDVQKLGSKIFGAKSYKVTDLFRKDIDTIVKEISVLNARQPNNFILERGVVFHQVISDIDPTSTLRTSNSDLANLDFSTIAKGKDHPKSKQPASSTTTTTVSGDLVQTASKKTDDKNRLHTLNKKSTVSKTDQTSIINKNDDSKNRQDVGGIPSRSAIDDAKSSSPDPQERPIFLTRHGLSDSKSDGIDQKHSDSFVYYSHGFVRGDVLRSSKQVQSLAVFPYVSILTGYFSTSLDPNLQLCSKVLEGGVCMTADCTFLHIE